MAPSSFRAPERAVQSAAVERYRALMGTEEGRAAAGPRAGSCAGACAGACVPRSLVLGHVSQVLGCVFPGRGTVVVSVTAHFERCLRAGHAFRIEVRVAEERLRHGLMRVEVTVEEAGAPVIMTGTAVLVPPSAEHASLRRT